MQRGGFVQKKCPRCGGNVFLHIDEFGWFEQCLQCSYSSILDKIVDTKETAKKNKSGQGKEFVRSKI